MLLLPFLPVAVVLTLPGLRALARAERLTTPRRLPQALALAAGTGLFLGALGLDAPLLLALLVAAGLALALPAFRALMPAGTLRAARGLPSGIVVRGLLAVAFLGCDAFLPLALTELRGFSVSQAGLVISAASLSWSLGSFLQARLDRLDGGAGRPRRLLAGLAVLLGGIAATAAGVVDDGIPVAVAVAGWAVAGLGIGIGYPSIGAIVLSEAPRRRGGQRLGRAAADRDDRRGDLHGHRRRADRGRARPGWDAVTALALVFAAGARGGRGGLAAGRRVAPAAGERGIERGRGRGVDRCVASPRRYRVAADRADRRGSRTHGLERRASAHDRGDHPGEHERHDQEREGERQRRAPSGGAGVRDARRRRRACPAARARPPRRRAARARRAGRPRGSPARRSRPSGARATGCPASSSSPWSSSASGWFCAVATRTGSPSA